MTKVALSEVKTIHQRPALMQEMQWRPSYFIERIDRPANRSGPADRLQLLRRSASKLVVNYDRQRTDGLDRCRHDRSALVGGYGPPLKPGVKKSRVVASSDGR